MKQLSILSTIFILLIGCDSKSVNDLKSQSPSTEISILDGNIIDLTHTFSQESVYWVTAKEFRLDTVTYGLTDKGYFYSAYNFETAEHGGTHIDAPIHFVANAPSVDELALSQLIGDGIKIDVSAKAKTDRDYQITIEDFKAWESENGEIPENSIVLLETGFSKFYPNKLEYLGTNERGESAVEQLHFPGLSPEAATWLVTNRKIKSIGLDTASIDYGQSTSFESHIILLSANIPAFENVAHLEKLPSKNFKVIALPMKIEGGSGGPLRIIALVSDNK